MSRSDPLPPAVPEPSQPRPRLNWLGQVVVALVLIVGIAASMYAGLLVGVIVGLNRAEPKLNAPPGKGVGMAPDLSGLFEATADVVIGFVVGLFGGLIVGLVLAWLAYRYVLKPLALAVPGFRRDLPAGRSPGLTRPGS